MFAMTMLLGMTAIVVDLGYMMVEKQKLGDAVDAAALAGVQDVMSNSILAEQVANDYADENGLINPSIVIDEGNHSITVNGEKYVSFFFAKAFGMEGTMVHATAIAQAKPVSAGRGFVPLAIEQQSFEYGSEYTLKYDPLDATNGNFGPLALGGTGASTYRDNLEVGYNGTLTIGMTVPTETGNMSGPTKTAIEYRLNMDAGSCKCQHYNTATRDCNRVMFLPIIDSLDVNGRSGVVIVGFAAFYLEDVTGNGNESFIKGRFLQLVYPGDWDATGQSDYGAYAVKLVH